MGRTGCKVQDGPGFPVTEDVPMRLAVLAPALSLGLALAAAADPLDAIRPEVDLSAAQVMHVWTPAATHELATGPLRPGGRETEADDRFQLASVTKTYVAAALLRLHDAGRLDVRGPAAPWLPAEVVAGLGGLEGVRIEHLLTMTSGLPEYLDDAFDAAWRAQPQGWTAEAALRFAYGQPSLFAPGEGFDYANTNYLLAQLILERASGLPLEAALRALVLEPAGATRTGLGLTGPDAAAAISYGVDVSALHAAPGFGDGGLVAPAAEVAAVLRALFIDRTLLSPAALALMTSDPQGAGYGMGLVIDTSELGPVWGHTGEDVGVTSVAFALPDLPAVIVLLRGDEGGEEGLLWLALAHVLRMR
jgi:D-alanyl-D-alanine carboxypeptidase